MQKAQEKVSIVTRNGPRRIVGIAIRRILSEYYTTQEELLKHNPGNPGKFYTVTVTVEETEESGWGKDK